MKFPFRLTDNCIGWQGRQNPEGKLNRKGNGNQCQKRSQQSPEIATEDLYRHKKEGTQGQVQTVNLKAKPAEIGPPIDPSRKIEKNPQQTEKTGEGS